MTRSCLSPVPVLLIMPVRGEKKVFWESTARDKAKFVKEEKEEDEEVERRRMKME